MARVPLGPDRPATEDDSPGPTGSWLQRLLDFLYPPLCRVCGRRLQTHDGVNVCAKCLARIQFLPDPLCECCGYPVPPHTAPGGLKHCEHCPPVQICFARARAATGYAPVVGQLVQQLKYRHRQGLVQLLGELLLRGYMQYFAQERIDRIVPVPLHWWRQRSREFNQAEQLAAYLAERINLPLEARALRRRRWTASQVKLSGAQRLRNVRNAFVVPQPEVVRGQVVLLVDDVYTTGSTLNDCSRALREAGCRDVLVLTVARAL